MIRHRGFSASVAGPGPGNMVCNNIVKLEVHDHMVNTGGLARLVDPNIGGIGHLLTATDPAILLPHGMMRVVPASYQDHYLAGRIEGFNFDVFSVVVGTMDRIGSERDHDWEQAHPFSYRVVVPTMSGQLAVTVSEHCMALRLTVGADKPYRLILNATADLSVAEQTAHGVSASASGDSVKRFLWIASNQEGHSECNRNGYKTTYEMTKGAVIEWRIAQSYINVESAAASFKAEMPWEKSWDDLENVAEKTWDSALGAILVEGGTPRDRKIFYTALYRTLSRMTDISEQGRYYSGYDHAVHDDRHDFYVNDGAWDTYRTMHPLQLLIEPQRHTDMLRAYERIAEQSGQWPFFPRVDGDHGTMIGKHSIAILADAQAKSMPGLQWETIYQLLKRSVLEETRLPWRTGPAGAFDHCYRTQGFYPALRPGERETLANVHPFAGRQSVSVTLECAYDDWCLAQMAATLGYHEDFERFSKRGQNYRNLFHAQTGLMAPRDAEGRWIPDFNPEVGGGQGGRSYFTECNSYIYSFYVPHDIVGLVDLMGGADKFVDRLDQLFTIPPSIPKYRFLEQFPDSTGLMGQYPQGNEPSFHIPYLYNYAGAPWKTQRRVREIVRLWYGDSPLGIPGDEDGGAMSSWYLWSTMGIYPTCPGRAEYDIGSPLWDCVTFRPSDGPTFSITTENAGNRNKFVEHAALNGRLLHAPQFAHAEWAREGGHLHVVMTNQPCQSF